MNNETSMKFCPNCGAKYDGKYQCCIRCGYINQDVSKSIVNDVANSNEVSNGKKRDGTVPLVLGCINFFAIAPVVFYFTVLWLLFGGLSENTFKYVLLTALGTGYSLASLINFILVIINKIKDGKIHDMMIKATIIIFVLVSLAVFIILSVL